MAYPIANLNYENLYSVVNSSIKPWELIEIFDKEFLIESYKSENISFFGLQKYKFDSNLEIFESLSRFDFNRYIPDDILTKVDRASMAYALEARVPLLDHRIVEFAFSLSSELKLTNGKKSLLKDVLYRYVPKELIERPKSGFSVPLKEWFRCELKEILFQKIDSLDEKFNKKYIKKLANLHIYHNRNYENTLWNLMRV
jgi:asparagine synthase (glutamine-hydrolysing)